MKPLKICFLNRSYYPDTSATGQLLTELAEDLTSIHGCDVTVVAGLPLRSKTTQYSGPRPWKVVTREEHNGVHIFRAVGTTLDPQNFLFRVLNYLTYFASSTFAALRIPRCDVVVTLTDPPIIGLVGLMMSFASGSKFIFLSEDVFPEVTVLLRKSRLATIQGLLRWITHVVIRNADAVVALGETMKNKLVMEKGADANRVAVIHNWADCSRIVPVDKINEFSLSHELVGKFVVMHSGNVGLGQQLEILIDAASELRDHPDILFLIIGDGVKRRELELAARKRGLLNIAFYPHQPKEQLHLVFGSADVFVVSLHRGLAGYIVPSKVYGILAAGRPYITIAEESCEAVLIAKQYDCGVAAEDAIDFVGKIKLLAASPDLVVRLGNNARRAALDFDRSAQVEKYFNLIAQVVCQLPARPFIPRVAKRLFDIIMSASGLLLSLPLWCIIALCIKAEDRGPVFYSQIRVGKNGNHFRNWKFRTMVSDADTRYGHKQAAANDPRITRIGRLLRSTAMDELPQLWNILKGDMSFVGPRALRPREIEVEGDGTPVDIVDVPGYELRHAVVPGLTGLAQIFANRDVRLRKKFRYDFVYIRNQSFGLDLWLFFMSFYITFTGRWERRGRKL